MPEETQAEATTEQPAQAETDWKAEARKWETRAKENKSKLDEAAPKLSEYDRLVQASQSDLERATQEATRWQSEAERWRSASVGHRIEALASSDFADPSDATSVLAADPSKYLGADGALNDDAIRADLQAVLEKKPHWRKAQEQAAGPRSPAVNPAQGTTGKAKPPANPAEEFAAIMRGHLNGV